MVDHLVFWGLNLGALAFVATLVFVGSHTPPTQVAAMLMGLSVLLGIVTFLSRLRVEPS